MPIDSLPTFRFRVLNAVLWSMASNWSSQLLELIVTLVLARLLVPGDFGLVALVTTYIALGKIFVEGGFAQAIIQKDKIQDLDLDTVFWTSLVIGMVLSVGTYAFGPAFFELAVKDSDIGRIVEVTAVMFTIAAFQSVQLALLQRRLEFKRLAIRRAVATLIGGILAITLAIYGFGVWSLVALHLTTSVVGVILLWIASDWRPRKRFSGESFRSLFLFGIHIVGQQLIGFFGNRGLQFFIGIFIGPTALGYYVLAHKLVQSVLDLITNAIQTVVFPAFSRMQNNRRRLREVCYMAVRLTSLVSFPMYFGLFATSSLVVPTLFGSKWSESVSVLQILCFIGILDSVSRYANSVMLAKGKSKWVLYIAMTRVIASYSLFFVVVGWGIDAVAMATVATGYLIAPVSIASAGMLIGISQIGYIRQVFPAAAASMLMAALVFAMQALADGVLSPAMELTVLVILGAVSYVAFVYMFDRSVFTDAKMIVAELRPQGKPPDAQ